MTKRNSYWFIYYQTYHHNTLITSCPSSTRLYACLNRKGCTDSIDCLANQFYIGFSLRNICLDGIQLVERTDQCIYLLIELSLVLSHHAYLRLHCLVLSSNDAICLLEEVHPVLMGWMAGDILLAAVRMYSSNVSSADLPSIQYIIHKSNNHTTQFRPDYVLREGKLNFLRGLGRRSGGTIRIFDCF